MFDPSVSVVRSNSRGLMASFGNGSVPTYFIYDTKKGKIVHSGKRKHVLEMWNTRYNFKRTRTINLES